MTALDNIGRRALPSPAQVGQATVIEQARAVAEVAAAVQVAQQFPRDPDAIRAEVVAACQTMSLARKAFYAVQNRGEGKSVHLARELARMWGNFQSGVHELRRDDAHGESEVQAFAWDVEKNNRSTRTFISPHQKMKKVNNQQTRVPLIDLQDIYLSNQNTGARAVRECIFAALPNWLVDLADDTCRETLRRGDGKPIEQRRTDAVAAFERWSVTRAQLEQRIGRPLERWDGEDVASLEVVWRSIKNGEATVEEQFEPVRVTASEIINRPPVQQQPEPPAALAPDRPAMTDRQRRRLFALLGEAHMRDDAARFAFASEQLGREVTSFSQLSTGEADVLAAFLEAEAAREAPVQDPPEPGWSEPEATS